MNLIVLIVLLLLALPAGAVDINQSSWSQTDASNTAAPPAGWPPNMQPNQVAPTSRSVMGAIKRWYTRINPTAATAGTSNAQTLAYTVAPTGLVAGDVYTFKVGAGLKNTGAATLNINGLGAKAVQINGIALNGGELADGQTVSVVYDGTQFQMQGIGGGVVSKNSATPLTTNNAAGLYGYAEQFGSAKITLDDTSTRVDGTPTFHDTFYVENMSHDTTAYTDQQQSNYANRSWMIAGWNGSSYDATSTNNIGIYGLGAGTSANALVGVEGVTAEAFQYGVGIADNEFAVHNPSTATGQSASMAAIQLIVDAGKGAADSSHLYYGALATNVDLAATAAFAANGTGTWDSLLDGRFASITSPSGAGIYMPNVDGTADRGSIIVYRSSGGGSWTDFLGSINQYRWVVNGTELFTVEPNRFIIQTGSGLVVLGMPTSCSGQLTGTLWNNGGAVHVC